MPKQIIDLSSSHNFTQFKKKNQPKRSAGSEVMSILNSTVFPEKTAIFCRKLLFYFLGFFVTAAGPKSS
jgi:hypothetical protein